MGTTQGPADTEEISGGVCVDSLVVSGTSGLSSPVICGMNTGQHVYMDMGGASTATATVAFTFAGASTTRMWEIKATQIPCSANYRPGAVKADDNTVVPQSICGTKAGLVTAAGDGGSKTICSRVAPFRLVFSCDTFEMAAAAMNEGTGGGVGFKLRYFQTTC